MECPLVVGGSVLNPMEEEFLRLVSGDKFVVVGEAAHINSLNCAMRGKRSKPPLCKAWMRSNAVNTEKRMA
jgi:hypothetical protein